MFLLELGQAVDRGVNARGRRRVHGEWCLLFESCSWIFHSKGEPILRSSNQTTEIESCFDQLSLGLVKDAVFNIETGRLNLCFTSGVSLDAIPSTDSDLEDDDLEWLFFVPGELAWSKTLTSLEIGNIHAVR